MRDVFSILIFLARKIAKTLINLAQNFREINADFEYIRYVFLILILIFLLRRIPKTHIILARNLGENDADFEIRYVFLI
jgi:hypothetical protein